MAPLALVSTSTQPAPAAALFVVGGEHRLLVHDSDGAEAPKRLRLAVDGQPAAAPYTVLTLPRAGGHRTLALLRLPESLGSPTVTLSTLSGSLLALTEGHDAGMADPAPVLAGLEPPQRLRVVRLLLEFGRSSPALRTDAVYVDFCRAMVLALAPRSRPLQARFAATGRLVYLEGSLAPAFGALVDSAVLLDGVLSPITAKPELASETDRRGRRPLRLLLDRAHCRDDALVVLVGEGGLALRSPAGTHAELPRLLDLAGRPKALPVPVRDYVTRTLAQRNDSTATAAVRELQVLAPMARRQVSDPARPVGAAVDLAVACPGGGLFVAGWMHDPEGLADGLTFETPFAPPRSLGADMLRFARDDVAKLFKLPAGSRPGFAAFLPGPAADAQARQIRAKLMLGSGGAVDLIPPPRPRSWADARAAVLGAIPPQALTPACIERVLAPAVSRLHAAHMEQRPAPEEITFGQPPADPAVSILIPLYKNLEFLRFQFSAFALDPALWQADIRFLLDSPEQRDELVHYLEGLHGLYGLPFTLLVQADNYGYSAANNAMAAGARGRALLCLNSDVIPDRPGWLPELLATLESDRRIGAVGPKLLFDDDSLQHAGLFFDRDPRGRWYNHHYFKGMPRDFAPANRPRLVPGVTGACLLMSRDLYERIGGFCEDYVIGDFEDSDLCLRIRERGLEVVYEPRVELYHLERRSISRHTGYTRGVASLYNGWLHAGRWADDMARLMAKDWMGAR